MVKKATVTKNAPRRARADGNARPERDMTDKEMSDLGDAVKTIFGHKPDSPYRQPENKPSVADSRRRWRMIPTKKSPQC